MEEQHFRGLPEQRGQPLPAQTEKFEKKLAKCLGKKKGKSEILKSIDAGSIPEVPSTETDLHEKRNIGTIAVGRKEENPKNSNKKYGCGTYPDVSSPENDRKTPDGSRFNSDLASRFRLKLDN